MDSIPSFSEKANRAKVLAGVKGGTYFKNPTMPAPMHFVDGVPSEVKEVQTQGAGSVKSSMGKTYSERK